MKLQFQIEYKLEMELKLFRIDFGGTIAILFIVH